MIRDDYDEDNMVSPERALADRQEQAYADAVTDCWLGRGGYWDEGYVNDDGGIIRAVRMAMRVIGATEADRWRVVTNALTQEISRYANSIAEKTK